MHNLAFLTLLLGVLLFYCEFIWIGKMYFGLTGAVVFFLALRCLWTHDWSPSGEWLLGGSVVCYAMPHRLFRFAATALLAFGSWKLYPPPQTIPATLAFPAAITFGLITHWLLSIADRARRNKQTDL